MRCHGCLRQIVGESDLPLCQECFTDLQKLDPFHRISLSSAVTNSHALTSLAQELHRLISLSESYLPFHRN